MGVIFAKTAKGQEEIDKRTAGLSPRVRRVLIFIDGTRTVDDLRNMVAADDLTHTLGMLEEDGFIEMKSAQTGKANAPVAAAPSGLPGITSFRTLHEWDAPENLAKARNFMTNTLNVFVGSLGASSLIDRLQKANDHKDLRELFDEWYHAIVVTRDGRREAEALRSRLLEVI